MRNSGQVGARRGRRPGGADTRGAILVAARRLFAQHGFGRTGIRAVASLAHVDPALVLHYFGSKERLFLSAVQLPFEPEEVLPPLFEGERESLGRRFAELVVSTLEDDEARSRVLAIIRAAASEPAAAEILRGLVERRLRDTIANALGGPDAQLRASLVASQVVGLAMARYVVRAEPLASLPGKRLVAVLTPTFQRYFTEPLR